MTLQPLSDTELDQLSSILERLGDKQAMNLEMLDGFLAALVCAPVHVPDDECLREIWGNNIINEKQFASQPMMREFINLVLRHRESIAHVLRSDETYIPLLLADENGKHLGNDWATGFTRGMRLRSEDWIVLIDDDEHGGSLVPIFALAHEHDPDPEMRSYKEPVSDELREKLIAGVAAGVMNIFDYFEGLRFMAKQGANEPTFRRMGAKVGRNDPCPCGSGRKFKHCCGDRTVH